MNPAAASRALIPPHDGRSDVEQLLGTVASWHDDEHAGAFRMCSLEPCHALQVAADSMGEEAPR